MLAEIKMHVMFVTERAVIELLEDGLTVTEIAPGIDLQTQVLDQMDFKPLVAENLKTMDLRILLMLRWVSKMKFWLRQNSCNLTREEK